MNVTPLFALASETSLMPGENIKQSVSQFVSSLILLQTQTSVLATQAEIDIGVLGDITQIPHLVTHQANARKHARYYLNTIQPKLLTSITDILSFAGQYDVFLTQMRLLLPRLNTTAGRNDFNHFLNELKIRARQIEDRMSEFSSDFVMFSELVKEDREALDEDTDRMVAAIGSKSGDIAKIRQDISDTQSTINGQWAGVAVAMLGTVAGGTLIVVGIFVTIPSLPSGASLVLSGVTLTIAGITAMGTLGSALSANNEKIRALYTKLANEEKRIAIMQVISNQMHAVDAALPEAGRAVTTLKQAWAGTQVNINRFIEELGSIDPVQDVLRIEGQLRLAASEWNSLAARATQARTALIAASPQSQPVSG